MMYINFLFFLILYPFYSGAVENWENYKEETYAMMEPIPGWCSKEKTVFLMDTLVQLDKPVCLEIGVFAGKSMIPILRTLQYLQGGNYIGIDSWNSDAAVEGFLVTDPNYVWWKGLDYDNLHTCAKGILQQNDMANICKLIHQRSDEVYLNFEDNTFDFIHLDGNHNQQNAFDDAKNFLPKLKNGGLILLNDPNWFSMAKALVFLLERCDILSTFHRKSQFLLLRKNDSKIEKFKTLEFSNES